MVRRDWCALAKDVGNYALDEILSGKPPEDVTNAIHSRLREVSRPFPCRAHMSPACGPLLQSA